MGRLLLDALALLGVSATLVLLCPFTKVEESFTLHATHDLVTLGLHASPDQFDHFSFTGALPRSLAPSAVLAWLSAPLLELARRSSAVRELVVQLAHGHSANDGSAFVEQILVRCTLAGVNALALAVYAHAVSLQAREPGALRAVLVPALASSFHLPFWSSRTLPNSLALAPCTLALAALAHPRRGAAARTAAIATLAYVALAWRIELAALAGPIALQALFDGRLRVSQLLLASALAIAALGAFSRAPWRSSTLTSRAQLLRSRMTRECGSARLLDLHSRSRRSLRPHCATLWAR